MTARRTRRRSAAYAALALGLAGSLALTGCNSSTSKSKKSSSSSSKSKKRKIIGGGAAAAGAGAGAAASRPARPCRPSTYKLRFSQKSGPKGQVTIEFKNTDTRACYLDNAPLLYFNNAKNPLPTVKGTSSTSTVTVRPRSSAYAVVPTNTPAAKGTEQKSVLVNFMGAHADSSPYGPAVTFDFAEKRAHISVGTSKVTNWNRSLAGARLEAGVGD
ncbi:DUF4232 domain-containing protein [Streptomyces sp. S186]|uniref:DUF4232 domain-containing protein n=1 Tax=Streptomyces sp. S186 TaxID=3434395 RepID=UPI003F66A1A2